MGNLLAELKRRHIYRVAAAYAVLAWLLLQLVNNLAPVLDLPIWVARALLLLLVIGFPVTILIAWLLDLKTTASANGAAAHESTTKLDYVLAAALIVVIALVSYQQLSPTSGERAASTQTTTTPGAQPQLTGTSIAVLPFVNLSSDPEQEFFSDGITEEITAALAKIPSLQVVARTSAFEYKGQNRNIQAISQALHASYVIEGSVRKAGDRVRITAQLIRADSGAHLWTENYDRQLTDIFATQEDIAEAIAAALRAPLGLRQGERLVSNRASNAQSYDQYLRAKSLMRVRGFEGVANAAAELEQVVARDPNYAPAWGLLARAYARTPVFHPAYRTGGVEALRGVVDMFVPKAEAAAQRAIQLDANLPEAHVALAQAQAYRGKLVAAEDLYNHALELDANSPEALDEYRQFHAAVGRIKDALVLSRRVQDVEPFAPGFNQTTADVLWLNGQNDQAIVILQDLPRIAGSGSLSQLARVYATMGRFNEAADTLVQDRSLLSGDEAARLLRTAPQTIAAREALPNLQDSAWVYAYVGAPERTFAYYEGRVEAGAFTAGITPAAFWHPSFAPVRKTERFKAYARKVGLVDYWKARGWPDLCRSVGADDFVCD